MQISCVHCGFQFTITAQQLGGRGRCPRCMGEIELPELGGEHLGAAEPPRPFAWMENSISALGSAVFHLMLFLILALVIAQRGGTGIAGEGEQVNIGTLPDVSLSDSPTDALSPDEVKTEDQSAVAELEIASPVDVGAEDLSSPDLSNLLPSAAGSGAFATETARVGGSGGGSFGDMVSRLRRDGLDIVIVFDSTGSMGGEISEVKSQVKRIGNALLTLIPKTRISICTYRDTNPSEAYAVKGQPLSDNIQSVAGYLSDVSAGGGGDLPEAVQEGLKWAVANNEFRPNARKVILLFGDAPPHPEDMKTCLEIAADFSSQQSGIVSTVTCRARSGVPLPEFAEIAQAGGGEAFLTSDTHQIIKQLLVLVFGSQHRGKVLEAFKMLDE